MEIDIRGPRFGAVLTLIVLAAAFFTGSVWVLALQTIVFAIGASRGPQRSPYGVLFSKVVKPRISPTKETEDSRAPQFAQAVGLIFGLVGLVGGFAGIMPLFYVATGFALAAAFLNAVIGLCLGCEMYLILKRFSKTEEITAELVKVNVEA